MEIKFQQLLTCQIWCLSIVPLPTSSTWATFTLRIGQVTCIQHSTTTLNCCAMQMKFSTPRSTGRQIVPLFFASLVLSHSLNAVSSVSWFGDNCHGELRSPNDTFLAAHRPTDRQHTLQPSCHVPVKPARIFPQTPTMSSSLLTRQFGWLKLGFPSASLTIVAHGRLAGKMPDYSWRSLAMHFTSWRTSGDASLRSLLVAIAVSFRASCSR